MIDLSAIVSQWPVVDEWSIAPAGFYWIKEGSRIAVDRCSRMGENCTIGDGCEIGWMVHIGDSCTLGAGCALSAQTALANGCVLGAGCKIGACSILGDHCVLGDFCGTGEDCRVGPYAALAPDTFLWQGSQVIYTGAARTAKLKEST